MTWISESKQHVGYLVAMLHDGSSKVSYAGDTDSQIAAWVAMCDCGGRRRAWKGVALRAEGLSRSPAELEQLLHDEWDRHVAPSDAVSEIASRFAKVQQAQAELDAAVAAARNRGASWARIGMACKLTRQAAHQRWGAPAAS